MMLESTAPPPRPGNGAVYRRNKRLRQTENASSLSISLLVKATVLLFFLYFGLTIYSFRALHNEFGRTKATSSPGGVKKRPRSSQKQRVPQAVAASPKKDNPEHSRQDNEKEDSSLLSDQYHSSSSFSFHFDKEQAEAALRLYGAQSFRRVLTAYVEPPLNDTIPGTGSRGDMTKDKDPGVPPEFRIPLPLRTQSPADLHKYEYHNVKTCHDMPGKFPIDRGLQFNDKTGEVIVWNVGDEATPPDFADQEAPYCPVEKDPFLPWIHDVFPSHDGSKIEFIAQNKRRCRTGKKFTKDVNRLTPQVALMQPVSVQRIDESQARLLAPDLWYPSSQKEESKSSSSSVSSTDTAFRYRLAPHNESAPDGMFTRFICRFHATVVSKNKSNGSPLQPRTVLLGETLSEYPFNYEFVSFRKGKPALLTPKGKDTLFFWTSNIHFQCPVPNATNDDYPELLRRNIASGNLVLSDGTPILRVDLVPIRTSVRYNEIYLTQEQIGPRKNWMPQAFDPTLRWGPKNVLPRIEASGRWENIPVCKPPRSGAMVEDNKINDGKLLPNDSKKKKKKKPFFLSACLWASAEFKTRGLKSGKHASKDTMERLEEWIEFHLLVGFDHIYLYDNSGAHTNETSLKEMATIKYPGKVTWIDWPSTVCNNNIPAHDSTGERSSQYAAENSCRTRYAPVTEWIAAFDTDEYLVPMGNYTSLKDVLRDAEKGGTQVLSFRSSRAKIRQDACISDGKGGLRKNPNATFLEAYNCDSAGAPKPVWADRARKQVYRADFVLYHYVHYSTVTQPLLETYKEVGQAAWKSTYEERPPIQRVTDELKEAVMIHAKTVKDDQLRKNYKSRCHKDFEKKWLGCFVAFPWPNATETKEIADSNGMLYNCFVNEKVDNYWVPKLHEAMRRRRELWTAAS